MAVTFFRRQPAHGNDAPYDVFKVTDVPGAVWGGGRHTPPYDGVAAVAAQMGTDAGLVGIFQVDVGSQQGNWAWLYVRPTGQLASDNYAGGNNPQPPPPPPLTEPPSYVAGDRTIIGKDDVPGNDQATGRRDIKWEDIKDLEKLWNWIRGLFSGPPAQWALMPRSSNWHEVLRMAKADHSHIVGIFQTPASASLSMGGVNWGYYESDGDFKISVRGFDPGFQGPAMLQTGQVVLVEGGKAAGNVYNVPLGEFTPPGDSTIGGGGTNGGGTMTTATGFAGVAPTIRVTRVRICPKGADGTRWVLAKDGLCYPEKMLDDKMRAHKPAPKPKVSAAEWKTLTKAKSVANKFDTVEKTLAEISKKTAPNVRTKTKRVCLRCGKASGQCTCG